jgi:2-succinyl-5-enolpyruvyl-6-hydroxy-3-cyclohexene-1-carboxylate synthase
MYTVDRNAQIVIALLKKYNIKKIVVSPGITNVPIAGSIQADPFFEGFSVVDERSAAYFATGLAYESGEPVAISCTGATASRNYLPALTEAYYRNLPIITITSQKNLGDYEAFCPQLTDRTVSQNDVKRISVNLQPIKNKNDEKNCILNVNKALTIATTKGGGPVHINIIVSSLFFGAKLPDVPKIEFYQTEDLLNNDCAAQLRNELIGKKIGLFIGSHRQNIEKEAKAIERFIDVYDAIAFCDHTSNYHGKNKVMMSAAVDLRGMKNKPDIAIDIGGVTGVDAVTLKLFKGVEFWRVSEDGKFHQRLNKLKKQFDCSEFFFFKTLAERQDSICDGSKYYRKFTDSMGEIVIPELPLSNTLISSQIAKKLPEGCTLHISILNSLRNMNFFKLDNSIQSICNVGGYGIDGAVSTLVGQSMVNNNKLYFGLVGDLAFFYDMNALGIRHIGNNIRILLVNNGRGMEFRINPFIDVPFGDKLDEYTAAGGHNTSAKAWAESMGFHYMNANAKEEFLTQIDDFCDSDVNRFDKPVLFEVFTIVKDEQDALRLLREANRPASDNLKEKVMSAGRHILSGTAQEKAREMLGDY